MTVALIVGDIEQQTDPFLAYKGGCSDESLLKRFDITHIVRKDYESKEHSVVIGPDGKYYDRYDDAFFRDPTTEELTLLEMPKLHHPDILVIKKNWNSSGVATTKIWEIPEGYIDAAIPIKNLLTFSAYLDRNLIFDESKAYQYTGMYRVESESQVDPIVVMRVVNPQSKHYGCTVVGDEYLQQNIGFKSDRLNGCKKSLFDIKFFETCISAIVCNGQWHDIRIPFQKNDSDEVIEQKVKSIMDRVGDDEIVTLVDYEPYDGNMEVLSS